MNAHQDAYKRGDEKVSSIAEHDIQMTPDNNKFNRDIGLELPRCWLSMLHANHPPGFLLFTLCLLYHNEEFDPS